MNARKRDITSTSMGCDFPDRSRVKPAGPSATWTTARCRPLVDRATGPTDGGGATKVLLVDDNLDATFAMGVMLRRAGHEVAVAHDGEEAVRLAGVFRPDVVIMDIAMPRMSGHEACAWMRREPWGRDIRMVALSAWGHAEDRSRSMDAGFDLHLVKPIDREVVLRLAGSHGRIKEDP